MNGQEAIEKKRACKVRIAEQERVEVLLLPQLTDHDDGGQQLLGVHDRPLRGAQLGQLLQADGLYHFFGALHDGSRLKNGSFVRDLVLWQRL